MPRAVPKQISCILCNKRTKPKERRQIQKDNVKILRRCFMVSNITNTCVICNKCSHKCYKIRNEGPRTSSKHVNICNYTTDQDFKSAFERPRTIPRGSPPSIRLRIPSTSTSHSYCFVCKRPGPKLLVATLEARFAAFIRNEIYIPAGSRCCSSHLSDGQLTSDALMKIRKVNDEVHLNRSSVLELLQKARETLLQKSDARVDFDDPSSLTDLDYNNLTGLSKNQFDDLMSYVIDVRASKSRSVRTCVAILLTKLRSALDNRMLGTLFNMSKFQVKLANSYTQEHRDADGAYNILISDEICGVISAKIQSRHVSAKQYACWIGYSDGAITSWCCKCKSGSRVVGACAHITSVIWYLAYARHTDGSIQGVRNWTETLTDASKMPDVIDDSESDDELSEE